MSFEKLLKEALNTKTLKSAGRIGGGCINDGEKYIIDDGEVFVKKNAKSEARLMFDGEYESLLAILKTDTVRVPKPLKVMDNPSGGAVFVMEYVKMNSLNKYSSKLGELLARLHLHNKELQCKQETQRIHKTLKDDEEYVTQYGFHCTTCCGYIPQDNTWCDDWMKFFCQQKIQPQVERIQRERGDREVGELWSQVQPIVPKFFKNVDIFPALMHGDLWSGNVGEDENGPVIFDPASFYGHSEFDLSMSKLFGGFSKDFFTAYHKLIPKAPGFEERFHLYQVFHYLNHWNHFGGGYKASSLSAMRNIISKY